MLSPELFSALSNRSLLDQRFATSLSEQTIPFLNDIARYIRERLAREGTTIASRKRLDKLLADITKRLDRIYGDINDLYIEEFNSLAIDEGDFTAKAISSVLVDDLIAETPSNQALWAAVTQNPLLLNEANEYIDFSMYTKSLGEYTKRVANSISGGFALGQTAQEMVQTIVGTRANNYRDGLVDASRRLANQIVRTSVTHISTQVRSKVFESNPDIIYGYRIVATLDSRTSNVCRYYDQQRFAYRDKFNPKPPFHPNCVLEGTIVSTCSTVDKLFKRAYKGTVVDIVTKSGRKLSITPNHPILTSSGWKAAKLIDCSDKLATVPEKVFIGDDYKDSVKAEISDLFSSAKVSSESRLVTDRPTSTEHFHGDGSDGEVSVVDVNGFCWDRVKSIFNKEVENYRLNLRRSTHSTLKSLSSLSERFSASSSSCCSGVGSLGICASFFKAHSLHALGLLFRPISELSKLAYKKSFYGSLTAIKADVLGDSSNANAGFISLDDVVNVNFREVDSCCHVYNLENKDNWYLSNGIITHNCRTTIIGEIYRDKIKDTGATRAAGFEGGTTGQVSAQKQYYDLLKRQPKDIQDDVLGKARGLIFRNSGLSAEEFRKALSDSMGRPLTLKEMAAENEKILKYMESNSFLSDYLD